LVRLLLQQQENPPTLLVAWSLKKRVCHVSQLCTGGSEFNGAGIGIQQRVDLADVLPDLRQERAIPRLTVGAEQEGRPA
jgi:hypothetical protein